MERGGLTRTPAPPAASASALMAAAPVMAANPWASPYPLSANPHDLGPASYFNPSLKNLGGMAKTNLGPFADLYSAPQPAHAASATPTPPYHPHHALNPQGLHHASSMLSSYHSPYYAYKDSSKSDPASFVASRFMHSFNAAAAAAAVAAPTFSSPLANPYRSVGNESVSNGRGDPRAHDHVGHVAPVNLSKVVHQGFPVEQVANYGHPSSHSHSINHVAGLHHSSNLSKELTALNCSTNQSPINCSNNHLHLSNHRTSGLNHHSLAPVNHGAHHGLVANQGVLSSLGQAPNNSLEGYFNHESLFRHANEGIKYKVQTSIAAEANLRDLTSVTTTSEETTTGNNANQKRVSSSMKSISAADIQAEKTNMPVSSTEVITIYVDANNTSSSSKTSKQSSKKTTDNVKTTNSCTARVSNKIQKVNEKSPIEVLAISSPSSSSPPMGLLPPATGPNANAFLLAPSLAALKSHQPVTPSKVKKRKSTGLPAQTDKPSQGDDPYKFEDEEDNKNTMLSSNRFSATNGNCVNVEETNGIKKYKRKVISQERDAKTSRKRKINAKEKASKSENASKGTRKRKRKESQVINNDTVEEEIKSQSAIECKTTTPESNESRSSIDSNRSSSVKKGVLWALPIVPKMPQKRNTTTSPSNAAEASRKPFVPALLNKNNKESVDLGDVWRQAFGGVKKENGGALNDSSQATNRTRTFIDIPPEQRRRPKPSLGGLIHFAPDWEEQVKRHHELCRLPSGIQIKVKPKMLIGRNGQLMQRATDNELVSPIPSSTRSSLETELEGSSDDATSESTELSCRRTAVDAIMEKRRMRHLEPRHYKVPLAKTKRKVVYDDLPEDQCLGLMPTPGLPALTKDMSESLLTNHFISFRRQTLLRYLDTLEVDGTAEGLKARILDWRPEVLESKTRGQAYQMRSEVGTKEIFGAETISSKEKKKAKKKSTISTPKKAVKSEANMLKQIETDVVQVKTEIESPYETEVSLEKTKVIESSTSVATTTTDKSDNTTAIAILEENSTPKKTKAPKIARTPKTKKSKVKTEVDVSKEEGKTPVVIPIVGQPTTCSTPKPTKGKEEVTSSPAPTTLKTSSEILSTASTTSTPSTSTTTITPSKPLLEPTIDNEDEEREPTSDEEALQSSLQSFALHLLDTNASWERKTVIQNLVIWEPVGPQPPPPARPTQDRRGRRRPRKRQSGLDFSRSKRVKGSKDNSRAPSPDPQQETSGPVTDILYSLDTVVNEIRTWTINKAAGETILHRAAKAGRADVVAYSLTELSMSANGKDYAGIPPVHKAAFKGHSNIVEILLRFGVDANTNVKGTRPLHEALEGGHVDVVHQLLRYGADPLLYDYSGNMPMDLAEEWPDMKEYFGAVLADLQGRKAKRWSVEHDPSFYNAPNDLVAEDISMDDEEGVLDELFVDDGDDAQLSIFKISGRPGQYRLLNSNDEDKRGNVIDISVNEFLRGAMCVTLGGAFSGGYKDGRVRLVPISR